MRYIFRKYLNNRGSALLMVLSTMTALMVCCMAMYFSVISSRSTQYAIFNRQQAYQSATSISDALIASMTTKAGGFEGIGDEILKMEVGDVLTTDSNGYKVFSADGTGKEEDSQLGAYMMTIKRLPDETLADGTKVKVYDIAVTSSVNGTKQVFHNIIQMEDAVVATPVAPPGPTNLFTATGYVPNDVFLDAADIRSDAFFDNELTILNAYGQKQMDFYGNVYCGGSMIIKKYINIKNTEPCIFAIRGSYSNENNMPIKFAAQTGSTELEKNQSRSIFMVGGDCTLGRAPIQNANVYVNGNLYITPGCYPSTESDDGNKNTTFFVKGNIILSGSIDHNLSKIYCNGVVDASNNGGKMGTATAGTWDSVAEGREVNGIMTVSEMINLLDEKTTSTVHYKWIVDNTNIDTKTEETIKFVGAKDGIRKVYEKDEKGNIPDWTKYTEVPIEHKPTVYLEYTDAKRGIVLADIVADNKDYGAYNSDGKLQYTLVVDTGDDPNNVFTIKVKANRDYLPGVSVDKEGNDSFCWYPKDLESGNSTLGTTGNNKPFQLLVMGKGSVVIDIPDDVIYQDDTDLKVMHYGWFALKGGKEHFFGTEEDKKTKKDRIEHTEYIREPDHGPSTSTPPAGWDYDAQFFAGLVHKNCGCAGDKCEYEDKETKEKCPICSKPMYAIVCKVHRDIDSYCKTCEPNMEDKSKKTTRTCKKCSAPIYALYDSSNKEIDSYCKVCQPEKAKRTCNFHVGRQEIDKFLESHSDIKDMMTNNDGELIYPTTNIFLVSCDENADFRFTTYAPKNIDDTPTAFMGNSFFGFVYAPYMTLKLGPGSSGGDMVRMFGGFTVSDYIMDDNYAVISCWPDKLPEELMDKSSFNNPIYDLSPKSWKIKLVAH